MSSKLDARLIDHCVDRLNVVTKRCRLSCRLSGRLISRLAMQALHREPRANSGQVATPTLAGVESRCVWAADAEPGYVW
ncbi:MAG: hypothetical protein ACI9SB_000570 [Candidatus Azotimanducaceae bacterium]|jgi:hypothetical protein